MGNKVLRLLASKTMAYFCTIFHVQNIIEMVIDISENNRKTFSILSNHSKKVCSKDLICYIKLSRLAVSPHQKINAFPKLV